MLSNKVYAAKWQSMSFSQLEVFNSNPPGEKRALIHITDPRRVKVLGWAFAYYHLMEGLGFYLACGPLGLKNIKLGPFNKRRAGDRTVRFMRDRTATDL